MLERAELPAAMRGLLARCDDARLDGGVDLFGPALSVVSAVLRFWK